LESDVAPCQCHDLLTVGGTNPVEDAEAKGHGYSPVVDKSLRVGFGGVVAGSAGKELGGPVLVLIVTL
jgi:hypothetical protein